MNKPLAELDHIVLAAPSLEQGAAFCAKHFGLQALAGGSHAGMGTHNMLAALGDGIYLEILAPDPGAVDAPHRWFGMAEPLKTPRIIGFVARTNDLNRAVQRVGALDTVRTMARGSLQWEMAYRADGSLADEGALPYLIAWSPNTHPTQRLPDSGCRLRRLTLGHPKPEVIGAIWESLGLLPSRTLTIEQAVTDAALRWSLQLETPAGIRSYPL